MLDLFGAPVLRGLATRDALVSETEAQALIAGIETCDLTPFRFQGWDGKRLTASFGWHYDFDAQRVDAAPPLPDWLMPLRNRIAGFAGLDPAALVQALLIRYDPGAGIGWHRDRPVYDHVIGLSLGSAAILRLRRRCPGGFDRVSLPLSPRGAYHLADEARHNWEHSIAPQATTRWSITFRSFADPQRRRMVRPC